ncbi:MAG: Glu-tRNA(Gln) amidotransferase subunit GatD [Candidatus Odinarchaeia archaeon]
MNQNDELQGYRGKIREILHKHGVKIWSTIRVNKLGKIYEGILLPRSELGDPNHIVLKLKNGYNIGLKITEDIRIEVLDYKPYKYHIPERKIEYQPGKPNILLLGTGGTVASRLDYRTGAVLPAFTPGELFSAVPELKEICNLTPKTILKILSENMKPEYWIKIAEEVNKEIESNSSDGIVIAHGTDTMSYTASALSFMLRNPPIPIVFVGSQRSSDRPSSDAALNLINACSFAAASDVAEVVVCMHGSSSDNYALIHRGTRVRKMHSSRRDAFKTIGDKPLGKVEDGNITIFKKDYHKKGTGKYEPKISLDNKVALLYYYPNMDPELIEFLIDKSYHGIILMGTGLGHVGEHLIPVLKRARDEEIPIIMTTQTLWGYTGMEVYETGRKLLSIGVIPCFNILPEVALTKLMWVLSLTNDISEVKKLMQQNIANEIIHREEFYGFLIFQGVESGIDKLLKEY